MTTLANLRAAISTILKAAGAAGALQLNANTRERAFEAFVFSMVVKAARRAGATVVIKGIKSGPNPSPLVFRGGPGRLGSTAQDFAYAQCALNGTEFEVHVDVEYQGSSGAVHEVDVSIVDALHADHIRSEPSRLPSTRYVHGVFECKFYDSTLGVALGRTFVGLAADCGDLEAKALLTNGTDARLAQYMRQKSRPDPFFAVLPLSRGAADRFVAVLEHALRKWACVA